MKVRELIERLKALEKSEEYFNIAKKRIEQEKQQLKLF